MTKKIVLSGTCVCPGEVKGSVRYYKKGKRYSKNDIVVLNEWITSGISLLKNVGGLLSARGGLTCHASIIAREFKIPCLVSVKGLDKLKEESKVFLDAAAETVEILK